MNVFIAGASGTIGLPLVRALTAAGHTVTAATRTTRRHDELRALGASAVAVDALDSIALRSAVEAARPTHVIHQLTALPPGGPRRSADLAATSRLRVSGTRHLLDAAIHAGARRFVVGSFAIMADRGPGSPVMDEEAAAAVRSMERQVREATARGAIEGVILRYGLFYGLQVPSTMALIERVRRRRQPIVSHDHGQLPLIHLDDAVSATLRGLEAAPAGAYDIVDDRATSLSEMIETIAHCTGSARPFRVPAWLPRLIAPSMARLMSIQLPLSNHPAKAALDWRPAYPTLRDGLAPICRQVA